MRVMTVAEKAYRAVVTYAYFDAAGLQQKTIILGPYGGVAAVKAQITGFIKSRSRYAHLKGFEVIETKIEVNQGWVDWDGS